MKAIYGILLVCCIVTGLYFLTKDPRWLIDPEHLTAAAIGAMYGFLLGRFLS